MKFSLFSLVCLAVIAIASPKGFAQDVVCFQQHNVQSAYCSQSVSPQFDFGDINLPCAVQAGQVAAACRQDGGRLFGCALAGFGAYLDCNGGLARSRRARRAQARSRARANRARVSSLSGC